MILKPLYIIWIPALFLLIQTVAEMITPYDVMNAMLSEGGPHELLQFFVITIAFFYAAYCFFKSKKQQNHLLTLWFGLAALCCLYVAGEEVSWGQHILNWGTPESWQSVNDQGETNLHNTSSWLDQKPRLILLIGIIIGGLIIPFIQEKRLRFIPDKFKILYSPKDLWFVALCVVVPQIIEKTGEALGVQLFVRFSEIQELYMFYFVLLYLIAVQKRELK